VCLVLRRQYGKHCVSITCKHAGTAHDGGRVRQHHCARRQGWQITRIRDLGRVELGFQHLRTPQFAGQQAGRGSANFAAARFERARNFATGARHDGAPEEIISGRRRLQNRLRPNGFVRESIQAVGHTFVEALILVVIVVLVFLQTWRASIIPLLALPVSLVGKFSIMLLLGFSLNTLSLFGLVLAIGIVVDYANRRC